MRITRPRVPLSPFTVQTFYRLRLGCNAASSVRAAASRASSAWILAAASAWGAPLRLAPNTCSTYRVAASVHPQQQTCQTAERGRAGTEHREDRFSEVHDQLPLLPAWPGQGRGPDAAVCCQDPVLAAPCPHRVPACRLARARTLTKVFGNSRLLPNT